MDQNQPDRPRRSRLTRACLWTAGLLVVGTVALALTVMSLIGTRVAAPDWLRERITRQISEDVQGLTLGFGGIAIVLQDDWVPKVLLQSVDIRDDLGTPVARLSDVQGTMAFGPLLRGELRPGAIRLSGASLIVRRAEDGTVGISLNDAQAPVEEAASIAALVDQVDRFFDQVHFASLTEISADNLTVRYEDARANKAWTVDGGRIGITRAGDDLEITSDFALLGARDFATTLEMRYASEVGSTAAELSVAFEDMPAGDIAGQSPALSWLSALSAPISGSITVAVDEAGALGPLDARLEIGAGAVLPNEAARPVEFEQASTHFTYDPADQLIRFLDLSVDSKWVRATIEGQTQLAGMEDGWPDALISQFHMRELAANPLELYEAPVAFEGATMEMRLSLDPFEVTLSQFSLSDTGGVFNVSGEVRADPEGWVVRVDGLVPEIAPDRLLELWPQSLEPKTRVWIVDNVKTADLSNIQVAFRAQPDAKPDVYLGFDFDNLESRFIRDVPHIVEGRGHASIYDNRFVIVAHSAFVDADQGGRIDISGSSFEIPDIRINRGPGRVRLETESTITAALSLLDAGPFRFMQKAGRPVTLADGRARVAGQLDFLVIDDLTPEDVAFDLEGVLTSVRSDTLVEGRVLAASELFLKGTNTDITVSGQGRVGQVPFSGQWSMPLVAGSNGRSRVEGWIELSERFMDEFKIGLPPGSVSGAGRGALEIDFGRDADPAFRLSSDLSGLALRLRPLDWSITPEQTGRLDVTGRLGDPPEITRLRLNAGGLNAEGSVSLTPEGELQLASFNRVQLGTWIDAPVDLVGLGAGKAPLIRVLGGEIDLRQTSLASKTGGDARRGEAGPVSLRLDRLQVSDDIALTDFNAELDMSRGADGRFTGRVNGQSPINGRVVPQSGRSAFTISSTDAGGVFRSANLLKQARGGELHLFLAPSPEDGVYQGKVVADDLRIKDAPAIAALLNALSVVGIIDQLSGEGIHFSRVQAKFQLAPDRVTIYSGSAVGASMGISTEGYYYPETGWMDMEGVVSPIYAVNMLGSVFSRRGEGLIGFTYSIDGPKTSPKVQVNPLSVLTPGMFREIFRRPPPQQAGATDQDSDDVLPAPSGEGAER